VFWEVWMMLILMGWDTPALGRAKLKALDDVLDVGLACCWTRSPVL